MHYLCDDCLNIYETIICLVALGLAAQSDVVFFVLFLWRAEGLITARINIFHLNKQKKKTLITEIRQKALFTVHQRSGDPRLLIR